MVNSDFADFFALLNQHGVEFLVIGGVAYNFHAPPRATKDIDVWVRPTRTNLERTLAGAELLEDLDLGATRPGARGVRAADRIDRP
jgi:hypothetical protein